jgi:hypothetical protein
MFGVVAAVVGLACADLNLPLEDALQRPDSFSDALIRDTSLYMLKGIVARGEEAVRDEGTHWVVPCEGQAPDLMTELAGTLAYDGTLDPRKLREIFEARYLNTIENRGQAGAIKPTVAEFKAVTRFEEWDQTIVEVSMVKRMTRRIFRSPEGFLPVISVAQTLETQTGDPAAPVRETEVGVKREGSEDWDFYAYDSAGKLSETSTFPAGERPSPRICISCHYDAGSRAVERFFP